MRRVTMKKVLIVDDEAVIREGIPYVVDWEALGYQIVGSAENGLIGLEMIRKYQPDLVMLDIQMPGKTGLEMVKEAKEEGFRFYSIILSGYSDFEYAQKAIQLGTTSYLLKPIDEDELLVILEKISKKVDLETAEEERYAALEKLFGGDQTGFETYKYGRLIQSQKARDQGTKKMESVTEIKILNLYHQKQYYQLLLANHEILSEDLKDVGQEASIVTPWMPIKHSLKPLVSVISELQKYRYLYPTGELSYLFLEKQKAKMTFEENILEKMLEQFLNKEALLNLWEPYQQNYFYQQKLEEAVKWQALQDLNWLINHIQSKFSVELIWESKGIQSEIYQTKSITELIDLMKKEIERIQNDVSNQLNSQDIISEMKQYTQEHYQKDLSLKIIGEHFNYNSAYLGKKFRKETGKTYLAYLEEIRMEKAKDILLHSNFMVYEIAEMVGYSNVDYFYKKFKNHFKISPNEFRKN